MIARPRISQNEWKRPREEPLKLGISQVLKLASVDLERIVAERTLDAVTTHGAMERTKAMMRGSKA